MNSTQFLLVLPLLSVTAGTLIAQSDWDEPFPPHRVADNLYYVGSKGLATYLVTTSKPLNVVIIGSPNVNPGYQLVANQDYPIPLPRRVETMRG